jgi:signal peptidase II
LTKSKWALLGAVVLVGFALDAWTKHLAMNALAVGRQTRVIGDLLSFTLVYNKKGVFGIDPGRLLPSIPLNPVFVVFSVLAMVVIVLYYRRIPASDWLTRWGLALVVPGAIGNAFDRIVHADLGVVDFIMVNLHVWPANPWPVFNLADAYVTVGVGLILAGVLRDELAARRAKREKSAGEAATGASARNGGTTA